jgi:large subunit ribosomal protein L18
MKKIKEINQRLRLAVFRSARYTSAQIIDDEKGQTLAMVSEKDLPKKEKLTKTEKAKLMGEILAQKALKVGIKKIKFDRRSYRYHGRVKALADGARKGGLDF